MPQVKNWVAAFSCLRQMSILMAGCIVKSPNDKKWLSPQRNRRNSYGEGPIASYLFYEWGCQTDRDLLFGTLQSSILKIVIATAVYL